MSTILFDSAVEGVKAISFLITPTGNLAQGTGLASTISLIQHYRANFFLSKKGEMGFAKFSVETPELQAEYLNWEDCIALSELFMSNKGKMLTIECQLVPKFTEDCEVLKYSNGKRAGKEIWHIAGIKVIEGNHICKPKSVYPPVESAPKAEKVKPAKKTTMDD